MSEIRHWLEELGLGQYADTFEENAIGLEHLPDLDGEALRELGVAAMGHRLTLLKEVASEAPAEPTSAAVETVPDPVPSAKVHASDAERRQITVMFCDLVGSTALSESLDPEDLRGVLQAYQKACGDVVERYAGHVAQYLGDGLMVYFGWPKAHEDDAGRAIRAGLEIVTALKSVAATSELRVRIGIATGSVVVGDTGAGDASVPKAAVGETPNIAARVQALAGPDEVLVGASTYRLSGAAFDYDDLGEHAFKGIVDPVRVWRVTHESGAESRFEARGAGGLTPLVGREHEIGLLMERWQQAKDGEGQVVMLSGEPGVGKSRIVQAMRERIADTPHIRLRYQCSPYHANSAYYPIIDQFERAAGFQRDDGPEVKLEKLETLLEQSADEVALVAPLFATLLSLPLDRYPPSNLSPQRQKEETIAAFGEQTVALSRKQPVLMIFEDVHWIDPSTLESITSIIDRIQNARVMLVITHRIEFEPHWTGYGHVTAHAINRLSKRQGADLADKITGGKSLPDDVLDQIVAKTDGVPLFVEELTKTVLEAGFLRETDTAYVLDGPLPPLAIPTTLQDSLMARLDRLSPVKEIAQIGAVIGRTFSYEVLAAVATQGDNELGQDLAQLVDSELVSRRGAPPDAVYTFKNTMVQEVAYQSLLKSRRQILHARIGEVLRDDFPTIRETQPELLAHHFTEAGLADAAVDYWLRAGERAKENSANREAVSHLENGLGVVKGMPESDGRTRIEIALNLALGTALIGARGLVEPVDSVFERARELSEKVDSPSERFVATWGLWHFYNVRGAYDTASNLAGDLMTLADEQSEDGFLLQGHHASWTTGLCQGNFAEARAHSVRGREVYDVDTHQAHKIAYGGHDPGVCARVFEGLSLWLLGYPDQASGSFDDAVALARRLGHPMSLAQSLTYGNWVSVLRREPERAGENAEEANRVASEHGIAMFIARSQIARGWVAAQNGDRSAGIGEIRDGLVACRQTGSRMGEPFYTSLLAEVLLESGQIDDARAAIKDARGRVESTGEKWFEADIHRVEGEIILRSQPDAATEAEACFDEALRLARARQARSLELRAAIALAGLWQGQGKRDEAVAVLAPVHGWFTEGFGTTDLRAAKALLEDLA
jgi:class 3 adenylate cyclase/predicted ATPase